MKICFTKMHGAGNDYVYVSEFDHKIEAPEKLAPALSDRRKGIGGDGLILIGPSKIADFRMRIFNNDGSEAQMCGNGSRCVAKFVYDHCLTSKEELALETGAGIKKLRLSLGEDGKVSCVTVAMGKPLFSNPKQFTPSALETYEMKVDGKTYLGKYICMGNPHFVIPVDDVESLDIARTGSQIENMTGIFPEKVNVEFAQRIDDSTIRMRVWERGSGITAACGTGACATAVAAISMFGSCPVQTIKMDGGDVKIEWNGGEAFMTGPAVEVFQGIIEI